MPRQYCCSSRLRELQPTHLAQLSNMLDRDDLWKDMASHITNRSGTLMFKSDAILNVESRNNRNGQSPTRDIITSWYTDNPTIEHLRSVLLQISNQQGLRAVRYIDTDILKKPPVDLPVFVPRPEEEQSDNYKNNAIGPKTVYGPSSSHKSTPQEFLGYQQIPPNDSLNPVHQDGIDVSNTFPKQCSAGVALSGKQLDEASDSSTLLLQELNMLPHFKKVSGCHHFVYEELERVTDKFNMKPLSDGGNLIGEGGFGYVFRGELANFPVMAIKRFSHEYLDPDKHSLICRQFMTEIDVLSKCNHENLLSLLGYSSTHALCVVYEYMPNGSLEDKLIHWKKKQTAILSVEQRLDIIKGVAQGLNYLHSQSPPLIHRDIKSANILLDSKLTAKIGDFGTVRDGPKGTKTSTMTRQVIGTVPYMPIEYMVESEVSVKMDAYSYGVVLLEILTGLPVHDEDRDDKALPWHVKEVMYEHDDDIKYLLDVSAGHWGSTLPDELYSLSKQFLEDKKRRRTIRDALPAMMELAVQ